MRTLKILALSTVLVAATASLALAGAGCTKSADAAKASAGCSSSAVKTADAGSCNSAAKAITVQTVRMPSGAMAVMYTGATAEAVEFLHASAKKGCTGFACDVAKSMASDEHCNVEMAATDEGVMFLVTADDAQVLDQY
jgi:hypothetical protein